MSDPAGNNLPLPYERFWLLAIIFFLIPCSIEIDGVGVSSNYSFLVLLVFLRPIPEWPRLAGIFIVYSLFVYIQSVVFGLVNPSADLYGRHIISAFVFIAPIFLMATNLPFNFDLLAKGIIISSAIYSLIVMVVVTFILPAETILLQIKYMLTPYIPDWPQRYITVIVLSLFLALHFSCEKPLWIIAAALCAFCIVLSNIRIAYLATLFALAILLLMYTKEKHVQGIKNMLIMLILTAGLLLVLVNDPVASIRYTTDHTLNAYENMEVNQASGPLVLKQANPHAQGHKESAAANRSGILHTFVTKEQAIQKQAEQEQAKEVSGSIRVQIWQRAMALIIEKKMWFGSGLAWPYLFYSDIGSMHSQYMDVLFRAGPIGLGIYLCLWAVLLKRAYVFSRPLAAGLVAWCVFSFVHETIKYSYNGFIFFALLSLSQYGWNALKSDERV